MKIKVCGITRSEDLNRCEESGADLMGFINVDRSKRNLSLKEIKNLISGMKNKEKAVMVLEPADIEEVVMKMKKTGVRNIQLHSLTPNQIKYLRWIENYERNPFEAHLKIFRAVGLSEDSTEIKDCETVLKPEKKREIEEFALCCDALVLDYQIMGKSGGTGRQIPMKLALEAVETAKNADKNVEIFLAGGINTAIIKNRREVLEKVFDYVDVNSGVEDAPGIKNSEQLEELLELS